MLDIALPPLNASLFTSAVQAGFVVGTLVSATLGLADRYDPRRLFFASSCVAAAANGAILLFDPASAMVVVLLLLDFYVISDLTLTGQLVVSLVVGPLVYGGVLFAASPHLIESVRRTFEAFAAR